MQASSTAFGETGRKMWQQEEGGRPEAGREEAKRARFHFLIDRIIGRTTYDDKPKIP